MTLERGIEPGRCLWFNERTMTTATVKTEARSMFPSRRRERSAAVDVGEVEAEVVLLREENAGLRVAQARETGVARVLERARSLEENAAVPPGVDGAWQALAQAVALREAIVDLCLEVEGALAGIRVRLSADCSSSNAVHPAGAALGAAAPLGRWKVTALRQLVEEADRPLSSERTEELQAYLHYLSEFANDDLLPETFDTLVSNVFGDLIEQRSAAAA
jgi:hypothetical protein